MKGGSLAENVAFARLFLKNSILQLAKIVSRY